MFGYFEITQFTSNSNQFDCRIFYKHVIEIEIRGKDDVFGVKYTNLL